MFTDLLKSLNANGASKEARQEELSDSRLSDLMDELFNSDEEKEEIEKALAEADELEKASSEEGEEEELEKASSEEGEEEELEKASSSKRRELMDKVYSLVDNLSEEELKSIVESRAMRKALAIELFDRLETGELEELVSQVEANGAEMGRAEPLEMEKACYGKSDEQSLEKANTQEDESAQPEADEA